MPHRETRSFISDLPLYLLLAYCPNRNHVAPLRHKERTIVSVHDIAQAAPVLSADECNVLVCGLFGCVFCVMIDASRFGARCYVSSDGGELALGCVFCVLDLLN